MWLPMWRIKLYIYNTIVTAHIFLIIFCYTMHYWIWKLLESNNQTEHLHFLCGRSLPVHICIILFVFTRGELGFVCSVRCVIIMRQRDAASGRWSLLASTTQRDATGTDADNDDDVRLSRDIDDKSGRRSTPSDKRRRRRRQVGILRDEMMISGALARSSLHSPASRNDPSLSATRSAFRVSFSNLSLTISGHGR